MYWISGVKFVDLGDSCAVGGDPAMNIIIARVPVLNAPEHTDHLDLIDISNEVVKESPHRQSVWNFPTDL